jgi:hypothetical protein
MVAVSFIGRGTLSHNVAHLAMIEIRTHISGDRHWLHRFSQLPWPSRPRRLPGLMWLTTGWWFSPGTPVSSTNKTDRHDITEILLKVALNIIKQTSIGPVVSEKKKKCTDILYHIMLYISSWSRFELTSVVIGTDCIGLANYHDDHGHDGSLV